MSVRPSIFSHTLVHVGFAFLAMGSWAVFANRTHAFPDPLIAGVVQGTLSATITLVMKKSLEALSSCFFRNNNRILALIAPPLTVCAVSLSVLIGCHVAAGTPEIAATIAVPFSVAFTYACLYTFGLWRQETQES